MIDELEKRMKQLAAEAFRYGRVTEMQEKTKPIIKQIVEETKKELQIIPENYGTLDLWDSHNLLQELKQKIGKLLGDEKKTSVR